MNAYKDFIPKVSFEFSKLQEKYFDIFFPNIDFNNYIKFILDEELIPAKKFYLTVQDIEPNAKFFLGLIYEYGLSEEIDPLMALKCYLEGALKYDPYCAFRLFYIYRYEWNKFNLTKNHYYEMKYLLISALFYSSYDNRFNKSIYFPHKIIQELVKKKIFSNDDFEQIFEQWKIENYIDGMFFKEIFYLMFTLDETIEIRNNVVSLEDKYYVIFESVNKFPLAHLQFLTGKLFFYGCFILDFDEKTALIYFKKSAKQGFHQSMSLLVDNYHNLEQFEKFCKKAKKYAEFFVPYCLRYFANECAKKIMSEEDNYSVLSLLKNSYFLGDFWSYYDTCELLEKNNYSQSKLIFKIAQKIYENRMNIGEILLENSKINIFAVCYRKGIGTEKCIYSAINIYEKYVQDNERNLEEYSYLKGLLEYGKILKHNGNFELSQKYYKKFYQTAKNEDNISVNRQFTLLFNIAKCLEKGNGCERDIKEALLLYQLALNTKKFCFYFEMKIKKNMEKYMSRINKELMNIGVIDLKKCN